MVRIKPSRVIAFALLAALLTACGKPDAKPQTAFEGFLADNTRDLITDSPELSTTIGLTPAAAGAPFNDKLDDRSAQAVDLRRAAALRRLAQIRALNRADLSRADALTYDVLDAQFAAAAAGAKFDYGRFAPLGGFSPYVLNQLDSAFLTLPDFLDTQHRVLNFDDADAYLRRLAAVSSAIDQETERAHADMANGIVPPDFIVDRTMNLVGGFLQTQISDLIFVSSLKRRVEAFAGAIPPEGGLTPDTPTQARVRALVRRAEQITATQIVPAYRRAWYSLAEMRFKASHDAGVWRLPGGDEYYRATLMQQASGAMTPEEIHAAGLARVRALSAEMDMMLRSQGMTQGTVGERMAIVTADPRFLYPDTPEGRTQLQADLYAWDKRMNERLPRWFRTLPKARLDIRPVPAFAEAAQSGAYYEAPSLDGVRVGVFYVNLRDMRDQPKFDLPTLVHHEGLPGHHLQAALAQQQTTLPLLRHVVSFNGFAEGWATYAEQLADEMGLYEGDPYARLGFLRWQTWRAARLVVDTGIHAKHWSKEQAVAYLTQVTGDAPGTIETEVERYIVSPGQACGYELGRMEIVSLRDKARARLGARFNIRDFHDAVLNNAEVPFPVLEKAIDQWIERGGGAGVAKSAR